METLGQLPDYFTVTARKLRRAASHLPRGGVAQEAGDRLQGSTSSGDTAQRLVCSAR